MLAVIINKKGGFMKLNKNLFVVLMIALTAMNAYPQDKKKDHPAISRYKDAELIAIQKYDYQPYVLGIGKQEDKDEKFRGHSTYFSKYIDLEGKLTRIQYTVPLEEGIFKVFENYKNALKNAGYQILFSTSDKESSWPFWGTVYKSNGGINPIKKDEFRSTFPRSGFSYIAAKGTYKQNNIYFAIFMNIDKDDVFGDNINITQDIIEINPMESGLVTAKKIEDNIKLSGFVSIYGIHFDTGKWNIKEESKPALKEISSFLKEHQEKRYFIVGHTDNTGKFSSNMSLSEKRAKAVMNALINDYGVKAEQIKAYGVSSLSPVTSNSTDEGKARNRRVEIVEQ
jgi:outer membrane protein OmpA-like peptidoglycan-associated protein